MQLSLHSDFALRLLMALAASQEQLSVDWIARHYGISRNHLAKVAQRLQAEGFIESRRGRGGGLRLAREAESIRVGDVVRRLEVLSGFVPCMGGPGCVIDGVCGLKPALGGAVQAFLTHLDRFTLADIVPQPESLTQRLQKGA